MTYLTVAQAAARLGVSAQRIRKLIGAGRIRATKHGQRSWLIHPGAVEMVEQRAAGRPPKEKVKC